MTLRLLDEVGAEIQQAAEWYEDKRPGLGEDFLQELEVAYLKIESHPRSLAWRIAIFAELSCVDSRTRSSTKFAPTRLWYWRSLMAIANQFIRLSAPRTERQHCGKDPVSDR